MSATVDLAEFTEPPRDHWGRPGVKDPETGKLVYYTRISTAAKTHDDPTALTQWKLRMTARGLALRDDLWMLAKATSVDDKKTFNSIVSQAMDAAASSAAANRGTALHSFTEAVDSGLTPDVPSDYRADIDAYRKATEVLDVVAMERFVVVDELKLAGSFDRLVKLPNGEHVIADLKTGKDAHKYAMATAMQMAAYAHGQYYDAATGQRSPLPEPLNRSFGLLIALPAGHGRCEIHKVDLDFGWQLAQVAVQVRQWRRFKATELAWSADG